MKFKHFGKLLIWAGEDQHTKTKRGEFWSWKPWENLPTIPATTRRTTQCYTAQCLVWRVSYAHFPTGFTTKIHPFSFLYAGLFLLISTVFQNVQISLRNFKFFADDLFWITWTRDCLSKPQKVANIVRTIPLKGDCWVTQSLWGGFCQHMFSSFYHSGRTWFDVCWKLVKNLNTIRYLLGARLHPLNSDKLLRAP